MKLKKDWIAKEEGWVLNGRVVTDKSERILVSATFHLPYGKEDLVESVIGVNAKERAEAAIQDLLADMVKQLPPGSLE